VLQLFLLSCRVLGVLELHGSFRSYCGLEQIHDHLQLRKLQCSATDEVLVLSALIADDIKATVLEIRKIRGNRITVGVDSAFFKMCENIRYACRMILVGVIPQVFQYM